MGIATGLNGNHKLTLAEIDRVVSCRPGAYALGSENADGSLNVHYIGRSDYDLNSRLKNHVGNYTAFQFINLSTQKEAYEKECWLYHTFNPKDNSVHPAKPSGTSHLCPIGYCFN